MMRLSLLVARQSRARVWLSRLTSASMLSLACVCLAPAQANVSSKSFVLPQAVTRSVLVDQSAWQGMGVELEYLQSDASPEETLEQLAMLLPESTPVWSEQDVVRAHWTTAETSFVLLLWATEHQGTEGLLSSVALGQPETLVKTSLPVSFRALDWLPKQASPVFSFADSSSGLPAVISSFTVPMIASQVIDHLKNFGERHGWLHLRADPTLARAAKRPPEDLALAGGAQALDGDRTLERVVQPLHEDFTFLRDSKRLSFLVSADYGNTTVLVFESSRDAP
jgi:hypothetical protein